MAERDGSRPMLGTIRNATLLLDLLSRGPAFQQLTDLADRSHLSLPTVHRLLRSLVSTGFVVQDPESARYGLGPELVRLSERYVARQPVLNSIAPYLVELRNTTKATITVALPARGWVAYVDRVDGEDAGGVFRDTGRLRHAFETASGRVLLAHGPDEEWAAAEAVADRSGPRFDLSDRAAWRAEPYLITDDGPRKERFELAVPLMTGGVARAALSATGSRASFSEDILRDVIAPRLQMVEVVVERALGHG